jgi:hypothetical protein
MVTNLAGIAYYQYLKLQAAKTREPPVSATGSKFPVFSGVDVQGAQWQAGDAPCRVIRVTDDSCSFCKKDEPAYEAVLDAARRASCEIVELAPKAGSMAHNPRPSVVQLKFIDTDVGDVLSPFVTPQTAILDRSWSLRMHRRGMFDDKSLADGIALLRALAGN